MSGASWKLDPSLVREKHNWDFIGAETHEWGFSMGFKCTNAGCRTTVWVPCKPESSGICFDTNRAARLTDREGNPVNEAL